MKIAKQKPIIYIKNKLLKYASSSHKGGFIAYLFISPKNFKKNIDEAEQAVAKQKSKKKKYLSLGFFLLNLVIIGCILGYQISQSADMSFTTLLEGGFSFGILIVVLLVWGLGMFADTVRTNILIYQSSGKSRPFLSYKTAVLGKYYDAITPMSTGGQPFQIYYLAQRGMNASSAISVPMSRYVINQICLLILWSIMIIISFSIEIASNFEFIKVICIIGFLINVLLIGFIAVLSISQKTGKTLLAWSLRLLQKMKIVKNYEKQYNKLIKTVTGFQQTTKNITRQKKSFLWLVLCSFGIIIINYSMPFLVYSTLVGYFDFSVWFYLLFLACLIDIASGFVPLPGGSGVSEISFAALFAVVFSSSATLTWALILWKFMTYYIYLIQGLGVLTYDKFIGEKKYRWLKRKWELESESLVFTQDKIQEYNLEKSKKRKSLV